MVSVKPESAGHNHGLLLDLGLMTKAYVSATGRKTGGRSFSRGRIYRVLSNALYIGKIDHKGARYPGLHPAIIDREGWFLPRRFIRGATVVSLRRPAAIGVDRRRAARRLRC
jgi:hypothetical protein